jgi:DnaJ domain
MTILIVLIGIVALGVLGTLYFVSAPAAQVAGTIRLAGPAVMVIAGVLLGLGGRIGAGAPLVMLALAWIARQRRQRRGATSSGQASTVRSAWLEMTLDHDSGEMDGLVLVGDFEGRMLNSMDDDELRQFAGDLENDRESADLLEAYLDRRMPGWRGDGDADDGPRETGPYNSGAMTHQEAYKVLGLEPSASAVEVRKAHRRLMQRVHPDLGGNAFLAQRVNEARDLLLGDHADRDL